MHGIEISFGSRGETRFDHVDAQAVELPRHAQLVFDAHAATGRLFAIA